MVLIVYENGQRERERWLANAYNGARVVGGSQERKDRLRSISFAICGIGHNQFGEFTACNSFSLEKDEER